MSEEFAVKRQKLYTGTSSSTNGGDVVECIYCFLLSVQLLSAEVQFSTLDSEHLPSNAYSFQRSVAVLPLPFRRSVVPCRCARERNCWNVFPLTAFEVTRTAEPSAKIGFDPICYRTAVTAQRHVGTATAQRNLFT